MSQTPTPEVQGATSEIYESLKQAVKTLEGLYPTESGGYQHSEEYRAVHAVLNRSRAALAKPLPAPSAPLPTIEEMRGLIPNFTGGLSMTEFLDDGEVIEDFPASVAPSAPRVCTCPESQWVGSEPNDSTCELSEEEHAEGVRLPELKSYRGWQSDAYKQREAELLSALTSLAAAQGEIRKWQSKAAKQGHYQRVLDSNLEDAAERLNRERAEVARLREQLAEEEKKSAWLSSPTIESIEYKKGEPMDVYFNHPVMRLFADFFAKMLRDLEIPNFFSITLNTEDMGPLDFTIQKALGVPMAKVLSDLKAERDSLLSSQVAATSSQSEEGE